VFIRILLSLFLVTTLIGCSTTTPPSSSSRSKIKLVHLEKKVDENQKKIKELEFEVQELRVGIDGLETYSSSSAQIIENVPKKGSSTVNRTIKKKLIKSSSGRGIIRVPISSELLQEALQNAGYYNGPVDGKIGSGTRNAIIQFQKDHDLVADGIVGKKTWSEMKNYLE